MDVNPTAARERRRWAVFLALAAIAALLFWRAARRPAVIDDVVGVSEPTAREPASVAEVPGARAPEPDLPAASGPASGLIGGGTLTFAELDRLLGSAGKAAAERFERALLDDPALPTHLKVALGRRLDAKEAFRKFLTRLVKRGGAGLRGLAAALLAQPDAAERLREALVAARGSSGGSSGLLAGALSNAGAGEFHASTAPRSGGASASMGSRGGDGPLAHDVGRLRTVNLVGKGADAVRTIASMFASMSPGERGQLVALCEQEDICDPAEACETAGLSNQCAQACSLSGNCPPGGLNGGKTPNSGGTPDGSRPLFPWTATGTQTGTGTDTGTQTGTWSRTGTGTDTDTGTDTATSGGGPGTSTATGTGTQTGTGRRRAARR